MRPLRLRAWRDGLLAVLEVVCAAYWFGNSGAGLMVLWWACRCQDRRTSTTFVDTTWVKGLDNERIVFAYVGVWRVVLIGQNCGRREVFRDELSEVAWTRLKRYCLTVQPATGRSTSI